jgi:hypothetical protein
LILKITEKRRKKLVALMGFIKGQDKLFRELEDRLLFLVQLWYDNFMLDSE